jgi:ribosome-binding ATPase YchF (GTP1/OBG family)
VLAWLQEGQDVRLGDWTAREIEILNTWQLLTAKPVVYLVNVSAKDYIRKKNKWLPKIFEWVQAHGGDPIIPFSGAFENQVGVTPDVTPGAASLLAGLMDCGPCWAGQSAGSHNLLRPLDDTLRTGL